MAKGDPWYYKYLKQYIRQIFQWSPERRIALKRAQISKLPELYRCEECGKEPLIRKDKEVDHTLPVENVEGWDGWDNLIKRAIEVPADQLKVLCKPCHYKKSAIENKARRKTRGKVQTPKRNK